MDKKGILVFLVIVLAAALALQGWLALRGASRVAPYLILIAPALAAWIARRASPAGDYPRGAIWPIPKLPALRMTLLIPAVFAIGYGLVALVRLVQPDWDLQGLLLTLPSATDLQLPPETKPMLPLLYVVMGAVFAVVLGPTMYALLMFCNEFGWRGYLLPRLMPLGRGPAYILTGLCWGITSLPLILFRSGGSMRIDLPMTLAMTIILSIALGEVWRRSRHLTLTAICSGCLVCHASGMWVYFLPTITTRFPWTGPFSVVALAVWAVIALIPTILFGRLDVPRPGTEPKQPE